MKRIMAFVIACVCMVSTTVTSAYYDGGFFYNKESPSWDTVICISPAGYKMRVKDYYNYMLRYAGVKNTTYDGAECCILLKYDTSCSVEKDGTMRVSCITRVEAGGGFFDAEYNWFGITIYPNGIFCVTMDNKYIYDDYDYYTGEPIGENRESECVDYNGFYNEFNGSNTLNGLETGCSALATKGAEYVSKIFCDELSLMMNGYLWNTSEEKCVYITTFWTYDMFNDNFEKNELDTFVYPSYYKGYNTETILQSWSGFDSWFFTLWGVK